MASITYCFLVRNSGTPTGGLTPTFSNWYRTSDGTSVSAPAITALGNGWYKFAWDAETNSECVGTIDAGNTISSANERYIEASAFRDSSRIITALPNAAAGATSGLPLKSDLPATAPTSAANATAVRTELTAELTRITTALPNAVPGNASGLPRTGDLPTDAPTANDNALALLDLADAIDGETLRGVLKIMVAMLAGKVSGASGDVQTIRSIDDTANRVIAHTDRNGNRLSMELNTD